jgi:hypothetical protein
VTLENPSNAKVVMDKFFMRRLGVVTDINPPSPKGQK